MDTAEAVTADKVIAILRAQEPRLRAAGIRALSLFGSVARGEARPRRRWWPPPRHTCPG